MILNGKTGSANLTVLAYFLCLFKGSLQGANEKRLLNDLFDRYNNLERPVENEASPILLNFGFSLMQIIDLDEKNQVLITNLWLNLEWNDANLKWNESEYGNMTNLRIPPHRIWKPDVLMYNSADEKFDSTYQTNVVVKSDGNCSYIPPGIFRSTCKIDITWFPFDEQKCELKFGSWTYDGASLDLLLQSEDGGDISGFVQNGEWDLIGLPGKRTATYYACCPGPYVDITFVIHIRRRTLYYFSNLIVPCLLIASMAVLGFTLPPDSGEKLSLGVTILLSLTLFLTMLSETMPETSDAVPLLGTYFNCIMFMVASSVVSTVLVLNYHHRAADTHDMPEWIRIVLLQWMPWILRMSRPNDKITLMTIAANAAARDQIRDLENKETCSNSLLANVFNLDDDFGPSAYRSQFQQQGNPYPGGHNHCPFFDMGLKEIHLILKELKIITKKLREDREGLVRTNEWKFAAMIMDRICLIVCTLFTAIVTVGVLASAPKPMLT